MHLEDDGDSAVFVETKLGPRRDGDGDGELLLRGPVVSHGPAGGPLAADREGFVATGLYAAPEGADGGSLRLKRDVELLHHGGFSIAASELDQLYSISSIRSIRASRVSSTPACFVLPDPIVGDRIFAAIVPRPNEPISLEALHLHLKEREVAPCKFPDKLLVVK